MTPTPKPPQPPLKKARLGGELVVELRGELASEASKCIAIFNEQRLRAALNPPCVSPSDEGPLYRLLRDSEIIGELVVGDASPKKNAAFDLGSKNASVAEQKAGQSGRNISESEASLVLCGHAKSSTDVDEKAKGRIWISLQEINKRDPWNGQDNAAH